MKAHVQFAAVDMLAVAAVTSWPFYVVMIPDHHEGPVVHSDVTWNSTQIRFCASNHRRLSLGYLPGDLPRRAGHHLRNCTLHEPALYGDASDLEGWLVSRLWPLLRQAGMATLRVVNALCAV
jgi:hypothetical protein